MPKKKDGLFNPNARLNTKSSQVVDRRVPKSQRTKGDRIRFGDSRVGYGPGGTYGVNTTGVPGIRTTASREFKARQEYKRAAGADRYSTPLGRSARQPRTYKRPTGRKATRKSSR